MSNKTTEAPIIIMIGLIITIQVLCIPVVLCLRNAILLDIALDKPYTISYMKELIIFCISAGANIILTSAALSLIVQNIKGNKDDGKNC